MSIIQKTLKFEVKKEENVTSKSDLSLIWERTESRSEFSTPSSKKGLLDNSPNAESVCKSDLSLIWERTNTLSPFSSPSPKKCFHHDKGNDILSLLVATRKCETPRKKLYAPTLLSPTKTPKKEPIKVFELFYKSISVYTDEKYELPDYFKDKATYSFLGGDKQSDAWSNFKKKLGTEKCSVISTPTMLFLFYDGIVKAKAITGTAQKKLESLSDNLPLIQKECVIEIVDEICNKERLHLFSTSEFHYSTVIPATVEQTKFNSSKGQKFRTSISGYIFPFELDMIKEAETKYTSFSIQKSVI